MYVKLLGSQEKEKRAGETNSARKVDEKRKRRGHGKKKESAWPCTTAPGVHQNSPGSAGSFRSRTKV